MDSRADWKRVSREHPCPICGRNDWCVFKGPQNDPIAVICPRTESDRRAGEAGWLHVLRDDEQRTHRYVIPPKTQRRSRSFDGFARYCVGNLKDMTLQALAESLGLSPENLQRLSIGWSVRHRAYTFPMWAGGRIVGIRLRYPNGKKLSVRGGHEGLFIPSGIDRSNRLMICEGPTDTAALLDLGFNAVGRPSCTGGIKHLVELAKQSLPSEVVILADDDAPGRRGAENLSSILLAYLQSVRIITPPEGIKDARAWKQNGATAADVVAVIEQTSVRRLKINVARKN